MTHSPAVLGRHKGAAKAKPKPSRLGQASSKSKPVSRTDSPEVTDSETELDDLTEVTDDVEDSEGDTSPSAASSARTLSKAANIPFPGDYLSSIQ